MTQTLDPELVELFGEPISIYTREQAIADGVLVDVTEWGSIREMMGGFVCPVAVTQAVWTMIQKFDKRSGQDVRGRAHDVLWMGAFNLKRAWARDESTSTRYRVKMSNRYHVLRIVADGDGITIGYPEDF